MPGDSAIEWTDATWNPVTGCSHVSPGCEYCYAERLSTRFGRTSKPWGAQYAAENVQLHPDRLSAPLKWTKPRRVFVNSMSDLFHEQVPDEFIFDVFGVMAEAERHTFQLLTKRPERMVKLLPELPGMVCYDSTGCPVDEDLFPLPNVWIGVSAEDQQRADERIPLLLQSPAAVRFISAEPLLGPLNLSRWLNCDICGHPWIRHSDGGMCGGGHDTAPCHCSSFNHLELDWVIVGGESGGPVHRQLHWRTQQPENDGITWVRSLRNECQASGVAFFFKQWGGRSPKAGGRDLDGRTWDEYPQAQP